MSAAVLAGCRNNSDVKKVDVAASNSEEDVATRNTEAVTKLPLPANLAMPPELDKMPTSAGDPILEEEGVVEIDEYENPQSEELINKVRAFFQSCDSIYEGALDLDVTKTCYAASTKALSLDEEDKEIHSQTLQELTDTLESLRKKRGYREVFDQDVGIWLYQYRAGSPWYFVFYSSHQVFNGGFYAASKVAVIKLEDSAFRIYRDRLLKHEYDLSKSPARSFVEYVHANEKIGHVISIAMKSNGNTYEYEIECEYLEGTETRKGTLSDEGWTVSSYLEFDYCVHSMDEHDLCYDRKLTQTFDPKTKKLSSAKGHYKDTKRATGKLVENFVITNPQSLAKARKKFGDDHLTHLFEERVPKEFLKPLEWYEGF